jgi:hypothetical protein
MSAFFKALTGRDRGPTGDPDADFLTGVLYLGRRKDRVPLY